jgi:hypothetical protein
LHAKTVGDLPCGRNLGVEIDTDSWRCRHNCIVYTNTVQVSTRWEWFQEIKPGHGTLRSFVLIYLLTTVS